mmetsp:Transcript_34018/g.85635  ORF Transcript_34018/g.85635 Transcript_34018/m.85635 type:complete len:299 (+) Transcript_34018:239-1135(+)
MTFLITSWCTLVSRTTPFAPICPRVASNWGFMSTTSCPPGFIAAATAGSTLSTDINDRSRVAMSTSSGRGCRYRRLVRSITTTRGSTRTFSATCPYPTSTPYTRVAPPCSAQSVNPPVESPASSITFPTTSISNSVSAFSSLRPPRHTNLGLSAIMAILTEDLTRVPALVMGCPSTSTLPCAIQDCTTVRLCSGWRSMVSSSRRCRPALPAAGRPAASDVMPRACTRAGPGPAAAAPMLALPSSPPAPPAAPALAAMAVATLRGGELACKAQLRLCAGDTRRLPHGAEETARLHETCR